MSIATGWVCKYRHNAKTTWSHRWHDNMKINTLWGENLPRYADIPIARIFYGGRDIEEIVNSNK